jgi:hypothetical protein
MTIFVEGLSKYGDAENQVMRIDKYETVAGVAAQSAPSMNSLRGFQGGVTAGQIYAQYQGLAGCRAYL